MKLSIRNFQSLGKVDLDVEGLTVLVGKSNTGKSALIRALQGVLFNLPGKEFVRLGAKNAVVAVDGLPSTAGAPLTVSWTKGAKNAYTVNGAAFSNVGADAPPAVQEAGYRDVWIGDEGRKKGESIRPQVADQFDPLFLLTRPGSFVSDVLSTVSRIAQLMHAQDRCTSDLKRAKQAAGLARTSLDTAATQLASLDGLDHFTGRVELLGKRLEHARKDRARLEALRELARRYAALKAFQEAGLTLPTGVGFEVDAAVKGAQTLAAVRQAADRRARLLPLAALTLPEAPPVPKLPQQLPELRQLAPRLKQLAALVALALPPEAGGPAIEQLQQGVRLRDDTRAAAQQYARMLVTVRTCESTAKAAAVEVEEADAAVATALAALQICPVCERPTAG